MGRSASTSCPWAASPSPSEPWWTPPSSRWTTPTRSWRTGSAGRTQGRLSPRVVIEAVKEVGGPGFLLPPRHCRFVPPHLRPGSPGRAPLQTRWPVRRTLAMAVAALLAITLDPAMRLTFTRMDPFDFPFRPRWLARVASRRCSSARIHAKSGTRSAGPLRVYEPPAVACCAGRARSSSLALLVGGVAAHRPGLPALGAEFMPPLYEGTILYMPTTLPGHLGGRRPSGCSSRTGPRAQQRSPRSNGVFGKAGRAETSTDPAPFSMIETTVVQAAGKSQARW